MYNIPYFKEKDPELVLDFIKKNPFALLIGASNNMPVATQVPFLVGEKDGKIYLEGHIMRQTDHHKALEQNRNVLCIFTGVHSYVSARSYADPHTASTWNYMSVHVRGKLDFADDDELLSILERTTTHFEGSTDTEAAYKNLPAVYVQSLAKAIIGIRIEITEMDHVFKLSQNKDKATYHRVINQLEKGDTGALEIAQEMKKRTASLFTEEEQKD